MIVEIHGSLIEETMWVIIIGWYLVVVGIWCFFYLHFVPINLSLHYFPITHYTKDDILLNTHHATL